MDFILKVQWSGEGMDENLINQLLALPGEELHLKKGDFLFHEGDKAHPETVPSPESPRTSSDRSLPVRRSSPAVRFL